MFDQQLTFDGGAEDIAPATRQDRLFTAPTTIKGQTAMDIDTPLERPNALECETCAS